MNRPLAWPGCAAKILVEAGLLLILPLIFSRSFSEQFTYPKKILTESVIIVAAGVWVLAALWKRSSASRALTGQLAWPLAALALAVLISCVNSPVPTFSLQESISFLCGPAWALLLIAWTVESQGRGVQRLYVFSALGGTVVALIVVLQWAGHDPLLFGGYQIDWGAMVARMRLYATFGNPNFVAGFLIGTAFLGAALAIHSARLIVRTAWGAAVLAMLVAITATGSRGAWIGLGAGLVAAIVVLRFESRRPPGGDPSKSAAFPKSETLRYGMVCLGIFLPGWQLLNIWLRHVEGRVFLWRAAWPMLIEHPIFGGGWATFQLRFLDLQARCLAAHPDMVRHWTNTRQLHNDLLQFVLETGVLGLFAWGWLLWSYVKCLRDSHLATRGARLWLAASAGGTTAILTDSLFNFQFAVPPTLMLLFTLLAVPEMLARREESSGTAAMGTSPLQPARAPLRPGSLVWPSVASLMVVGVGGLLLFQTGREAVAERDLAQGRQLESRGEIERAEETYRHGIHANPLNGRLHFGLARTLYSSERYAEALEEIPRAERTFADSHLEVLKARIEDQMGMAAPALAAYRHALALDPTLKTVQADIERLSKPPAPESAKP